LHGKLFGIKETDSGASKEENPPTENRGRFEQMARRDVGSVEADGPEEEYCALSAPADAIHIEGCALTLP
jgi:hypothetical protein